MKRDRLLIQVALAWVLAQDGITSAIVGATRAEQLDESLPGTSISLEPEEQEACDDGWYRLPRTRHGSGGVRRTR